MNQPNYFLIQRKALARFREKIPFLTLVPDTIYHRLSPIVWYEPFGELVEARAQLEQEELDCYIMIYKRFEPDIPWEAQLFVYIEEANLTPEKQAMLDVANEVTRRLRITFQAFEKPLKIRKRPLEHPFAHCDPPDADGYQPFVDLDPEGDIPF
jgi:hypothetical protein